jgi:antitoxin component YwqK of YwqJK toxin-antitoxin module
MDTIEEIKKLKALLDQGAITEEEFIFLKKGILMAVNESTPIETSIAHEQPVQEKELNNESAINITKNHVSNADKKGTNNNNLYAKYIVFSSLLLLIISGIAIGISEGSFISSLIAILIIAVIFFVLLKVINLKFSKLTSSLIMTSIPIIMLMLFIFHINLFSKYTFDSNVKRVKTFQFNRIPCEVYYIRKDSCLIKDSDTLYLMTGMYKRYNEKGKLVAEGRLQDGICRGKWMVKDDDKISSVIQFDDIINHDSILKRNAQYKINRENYDSYSEDKIVDNMISQNGYFDTFTDNESTVGICNSSTHGYFYGGLSNGDFSILYNNKIWFKGKTKYGYLDGEFKYYTPEGKIYKTINYKNGVPLDIKVNDENIKAEPVEIKNGEGRIVTSKLFNGNYQGSYKCYDKYGKVIVEGFYLDGNRHGEFKYYGRFCGRWDSRDCSYHLKLIEPYYNGYLNGLLTSYWSEQGNYSDEVGDVKNYTQIYRYGKKHGKFTKFSSSASYDNRHIWYTEEYKNGILVENSTVNY